MATAPASSSGEAVLVLPATLANPNKSAGAVYPTFGHDSQQNPNTVVAIEDPVKSAPRPWWHSVVYGPNFPSGSKRYLAFLSYLSIGIIYGDIGTSPLYTFSTIFLSPPTESDVIGALSLMIWALLIIVAFKYVVFVLCADDHGEGGTFAIYALLSRGLRQKIKNDRVFNAVNMVMATIAIVGVSAVLSDGVLTPAISILGAVQGLTIASPSLQSSVVPVTCCILFVFFLLQRFGTMRVSFLFSPIMTLWFFVIAAIGISNIVQCPRVLKAFSPSFGFQFFLTHKYDGWVSLGAIFLTITGSEALFADLGHFNAKAIRFSALCLVLPSLFLAYCGQAAALILNPSVVSNTFYLGFSSKIFYPMLILATAAAIIASQAMISASFSLITQAMKLNCFPRMTVKHTDHVEYGHVYVREINYFYMVATIVVVAGYENATALGYAYGIAVNSVFFITTIFYSVVIITNFNKHWIFGMLFFIIFGFIDICFLSSNLLKFPTGGWFTVTITAIFSLVMSLWRWGRLRMIQYQSAMCVAEVDLFAIEPAAPKVVTDYPQSDASSVAVVNNCMCLCYSSVPDSVPAAFVHFLRCFPARPEYLVFITINAVNIPFVRRNFVITPVPGKVNVYKIIITYGYAEEIPNATTIAAAVIRQTGIRDECDLAEMSDDELVAAVRPSFIIGRDRATRAPGHNIVHQFFVDLFQVMLVLSRSASASLRIPPQSMLEIGLPVPI